MFLTSKIVRKKDEYREMFFNEIMKNIIDYELKEKEHVDAIYLSSDNMYIKYLLEKSEIKITRKTITNAILFAASNNEVAILR